MRRFTRLLVSVLLLWSLAMVGHCENGKFVLKKGSPSKEAHVKTEDLELDVKAGDPSGYLPDGKKFALKIGICTIQITAGKSPSGFVQFDFKDSTVSVTAPSKIYVSKAKVIFFGKNGNQTVPECEPEFTQAGDSKFTIPLELGGSGVPDVLEISGQDAWTGDGDADKETNKSGLDTWQILIIAGAIVFVLILVAVGAAVFWVCRRRRLNKKKQDGEVRTAIMAVEEGKQAPAKTPGDQGRSKSAKPADDPKSKKDEPASKDEGTDKNAEDVTKKENVDETKTTKKKKADDVSKMESKRSKDETTNKKKDDGSKDEESKKEKRKKKGKPAKKEVNEMSFSEKMKHPDERAKRVAAGWHPDDPAYYDAVRE